MYRDLLSAFGTSTKKIHQILNREDCKLEDLLAEEETISQCNSQNAKLLEFICRKENLSRLIQYATRDPEDPSKKDASFKYLSLK
jgi:serine/threonine-protein phosphatase 6 regulatory subunit 3